MNFPITFSKAMPEVELFAIQAKAEHGFKVTIIFDSDTAKLYGVAEQTYHNATEVHWKYPTSYGSGQGVATESNLHYTGCTHDLEQVHTVTVDVETELCEEF